MTLFLDAHLPPSLALWIHDKFGFETYSFDFKGWKFTSDLDVFLHTKRINNSVIIPKDEDFVALLNKLHAPPKIIWINVRKHIKPKP